MGNLRWMDYQLRSDRDLTILIPARAGSKRCPGKNTRMLGGKPLIEWTIDPAKAANVAKIIVSSDDPAIWPMARYHELELHIRKPAHATDDASDFSWVYDLREMIVTPYFAILRPTSPFRTASTIRRAYAMLVGSKAHSVRAVERVTHPHPAKMWECIPGSHYMRPIQHGSFGGTPWHSLPTQSLPPVYKQNASLEMAQTWVIEGTKTISGYTIAPFLTEDREGIDINDENDFALAELIMLERDDPAGYGHAV
jgi:CMP-N,N'-diacetyllegionaminic acid synthase